MKPLSVAANSTRSIAQSSSPLILAIEDSDEDYEVLRRSFRQSAIVTRLHRCQTGKQALEYLERYVRSNETDPAAIPALILLDLNLPGIDGRRVLETIKQDPVWRYIPTLILTTSSFAKDVEECYRLGANSYILKAIDLQQFKESIAIAIDFWLDVAELPRIADVIRSSSNSKKN